MADYLQLAKSGFASRASENSVRASRRPMFSRTPKQNLFENRMASFPAFRVAALITLLVAIIFVGVMLTKSEFDWAEAVKAQEPTTISAPHAPTTSAPTDNPSVGEETSQTSSAPGRQVFISFDGLPYDLQYDPYGFFDWAPLTYALPSNQYQDAIFSSSPGYHVATYGRQYTTNRPSLTRASDFNNYSQHLAPLVVDFPKPVTDLIFDVDGIDSVGRIATLEIYQNGIHTQTRSVYGNGYVPVTQYEASTFTNVTRIVVNQITDPFGIVLDNFRFTVLSNPNPTPTPTPNPTPPPVPTNVKATPE